MMKWSREAFVENEPRNRFEDVFCYDTNRVQLKGIDNGYIHANKVQLPGEMVTYTLAQAPLERTVGHFWRMIWQMKPALLVVLSQPRSDEERYLPMIGQEYTFAEFKVKRKFELEWNKTRTITECVVSQVQEEDEEESESGDVETIKIRCLIWNEWATDNDVPTPDKMIQFVREMHSQVDEIVSTTISDKEKRAEAVIVCPSGAFRSGLFAACSALMRSFDGELFAADQVSRVVQSLREVRHRTIDRFSQYVYLHWLICQAVHETADQEEEEEKLRIIRAVERARTAYLQMKRDEILAAMR